MIERQKTNNEPLNGPESTYWRRRRNLLFPFVCGKDKKMGKKNLKMLQHVFEILSSKVDDDSGYVSDDQAGEELKITDRSINALG